MIKFKTPFLILIILPIFFFIVWIVLSYLKVSDNDVAIYKTNSGWHKIRNLELVEKYKKLGIITRRRALYKDISRNKYYLLDFYTISKSESPRFELNGEEAYLFINEVEETKGSYESPILALNYASEPNLNDQLSVEKYEYNVKNYLRFHQNDKYVSASSDNKSTKYASIIIGILIMIVLIVFIYLVKTTRK